jgi:hypothetical protein
MAVQKQPKWSDHVPDDEGRQQLDTHVFAQRHGPRDFLPPPRVRPQIVREFIEARFRPDLAADQMCRMGDLARFYVLSDSSRKFLLPLERRERTPQDCLRSVECVRVLGDVGDNSQQQFAGEYFDYLARHTALESFAEPLVLSYFSLDPFKQPDKLAARLEAEIKALAPDESASERREQKHQFYVEQRENALELIVAVKARKDKLLIEADDLKRATGWARLYIGLDDPGGVKWGEVAGYALLAEAPRSSRENAVAGLRVALAAVKPGERKEYLDFARQRGARAIVYLGGAPTPDEAAWVGEMPSRRHLLAG